MEIISAVIGVVLGFLINEIVNYFRKRGEQQQQAQSIKTLIGIEIDHNLALLSELSQRLNKEAEEMTAPKEIQMPNFLARMSMPVWSHRLWESQFTNLTLALNAEAIRKVYEFHSCLDSLLEKVLAIRDNPKQITYRKELYDQCIELINRLLQNGNPLADKPPFRKSLFSKKSG